MEIQLKVFFFGCASNFWNSCNKFLIHIFVSTGRRLFIAEYGSDGNGDILRYKINIQNPPRIYIHRQGHKVRSLSVIGDRLWILEQGNGLKSISINNHHSRDVEAVTANTTGLNCTQFSSMHFAIGK